MYPKWCLSIRMSYLRGVMDVTQVSFVWNLPTNTDRILKGDTEYTGFKEAGLSPRFIHLENSLGSRYFDFLTVWIKRLNFFHCKKVQSFKSPNLDIKKILPIYIPFYLLQDVENGSYSELYLYLSRNSTFSRSLISN